MANILFSDSDGASRIQRRLQNDTFQAESAAQSPQFPALWPQLNQSANAGELSVTPSDKFWTIAILTADVGTERLDCQQLRVCSMPKPKQLRNLIILPTSHRRL
jgi:hypothetical protein